MFDETKNYWLEFDRETGVYQFRCENKASELKPTYKIEEQFDEIKSTEFITDPLKIIDNIQSCIKRIYRRALFIKPNCKYINEKSADFIVTSKESNIELLVSNYLEKVDDSDIEYKIIFDVEFSNQQIIFDKHYKFLVIALRGNIDYRGKYKQNKFGIYLFDYAKVESNLIKFIKDLA